MPDDDAHVSTAATEEQRTEAAVLRILLGQYPEQLTVEELQREVAGADPDFGQLDSVNQAIRRLGSVGLVHQQGMVVWPSRAARYIEALELP